MSEIKHRTIKYPALQDAMAFCRDETIKSYLDSLSRGRMLNSFMSIKNNRLLYKMGKGRKAVVYELDLLVAPDQLAQQFTTFITQLVKLVDHNPVEYIAMTVTDVVTPAMYRKRLIEFYQRQCMERGMTAEQTAVSLDNIQVAYDLGIITTANITHHNGVIYGVDNVYADPKSGVLFAYREAQRTPLQPPTMANSKVCVIKDISSAEQNICRNVLHVISNINGSTPKSSGVTPYERVDISLPTLQ